MAIFHNVQCINTLKVLGGFQRYFTSVGVTCLPQFAGDASAYGSHCINPVCKIVKFSHFDNTPMQYTAIFR